MKNQIKPINPPINSITGIDSFPTPSIPEMIDTSKKGAAYKLSKSVNGELKDILPESKI